MRKRIEAIVTTVARRIDRIKKHAQTQRTSYSDTVGDDVADHTGKGYRISAKRHKNSHCPIKGIVKTIEIV